MEGGHSLRQGAVFLIVPDRRISCWATACSFGEAGLAHRLDGTMLTAILLAAACEQTI